jgi:hypothetical protein
VRTRDDDRFRSSRPDQRALRERVTNLRADEQRYRSHVFRNHVDIGPSGTRTRALDGFDPARPGRSQSSDVTRWTSEHYLARAVMGVERSHDYRTKMTAAEEALRRGEPPHTVRPVVRIPLRDAIGPDWHSGVAGHVADSSGVRPSRFTNSAEVVAVYRARPGGGWYLQTCYPHPRGKGP